MRRHVVLIALALLSVQAGCSSVTLDPRKSEFWIGGTVDPTDRARLALAASIRNDSLPVYREAYYSCASDYAGQHAAGRDAAGDIADAATGACRERLNTSLRAIRTADSLAFAAHHVDTPPNADGLEKTTEQDIDYYEKELTEQARKLAIKAVIEHRP